MRLLLCVLLIPLTALAQETGAPPVEPVAATVAAQTDAVAAPPAAVAAQSDPAVAPSEPAPIGMFTAARREQLLAEGRPLYLRHCATCHGAEGDGKGPSAPFLDHPPRNFLTGSYNFRMTPLGSLAREEDVYRTISLGVLRTAMPAWRDSLSHHQRRTLSRYVLALSARTLTEVPGPTLVIPPEPPDDEASRSRGRALFTEYGCNACHGDQGRGDGAASAALVDENGAPIRPANFHVGFQGGKGAVVAFRAISTGLNGTPMPSFGPILDDAQRWDLAHFVHSLQEPRSAVDYLFNDPAGRIQEP